MERALLPAAFDFCFSPGAPFLAYVSLRRSGIFTPAPISYRGGPTVRDFRRIAGSPHTSSPVIVISGTRSRLIVASSARISSVSPDAESASTTSPRTTIPKSPCRASTGCRYSAGVPVELSVCRNLACNQPALPHPRNHHPPRARETSTPPRAGNPPPSDRQCGPPAPAVPPPQCAPRSRQFVSCNQPRKKGC